MFMFRVVVNSIFGSIMYIYISNIDIDIDTDVGIDTGVYSSTGDDSAATQLLMMMMMMMMMRVMRARFLAGGGGGGETGRSSTQLGQRAEGRQGRRDRAEGAARGNETRARGGEGVRAVPKPELLETTAYQYFF